ncbi:condensation domain-containing protein [Chitinophaga nivalis]|uniref:Condensation domain-containing protein n=1 Tax=Chitinophaga nivalis TaxID=2991709 RepID=A0ABT3IM06_9BACT|nr:condensation domain-containing protein [Chitinophaga nivalis]MCW3465313.1 condensation domain-containing protein [Chitinophaga nivalis]MCW3484995.1 condensation domain-containing protein [Chitinophaga nivalis]
MTRSLHEAFAKQYEDWIINEQYDVEILLSKIRLDTFDRTAFEKAYRTVVERHESLRTVFIYEASTLYQQVLSGDTAAGFAPIYLDSAPDQVSVATLMPMLMQTMRNLSAPPLFRIYVIPDGTSAIVYLALHHIISDEWSVKILISELTEAYAAWQANTPPAETPLPLQLKDYSRLKNEEWHLKKEERIQYWLHKLTPLLLGGLQNRLIKLLQQNETAVSLHPSQYDAFLKGVLNTPGKAMQYACPLPADTYAQLQQLSASSRISRPGILLANATLLFYTVYKQPEIMISTLAGDRFKKQTARLIGHLMGGSFIRVPVNPQHTVLQVIQQTYLEFLQTMKYLLLNYDDFRDLPLQSASLLHVNYLNESFRNEAWEQPVWGHTPIDLVFYPLSVIIADDGDSCSFQWNYHSSFYTPEQLTELATQFNALLHRITSSPEIPVDRLFQQADAE